MIHGSVPITLRLRLQNFSVTLALAVALRNAYTKVKITGDVQQFNLPHLLDQLLHVAKGGLSNLATVRLRTNLDRTGTERTRNRNRNKN